MENQIEKQIDEEIDDKPQFSLPEGITIEDGMIIDNSKEQNHTFANLRLKGLLLLMRDSSWDFPAAMMAIGFSTNEEDGEFTMHPGPDEYEYLNSLLDPDDQLQDGDLDFDT